MGTAMRVRAPRLAHADRRQVLLDVALALLEDGGSEAVRMDALARAAGVSRPVVYEHFANREALLIALIEEHGRHLGLDFPRAGGSPHDFEAELRASVRAYLDQVRRRGVALRALQNAVGFSAAIERTRERLWSAGIDRWAERYCVYCGIDRADARALAEFHLQGLWALAGRCANGEITAQRVEDLHVAVVIGSLQQLA